MSIFIFRIDMHDSNKSNSGDALDEKVVGWFGLCMNLMDKFSIFDDSLRKRQKADAYLFVWILFHLPSQKTVSKTRSNGFFHFTFSIGQIYVHLKKKQKKFRIFQSQCKILNSMTYVWNWWRDTWMTLLQIRRTAKTIQTQHQFHISVSFYCWKGSFGCYCFCFLSFFFLQYINILHSIWHDVNTLDSKRVLLTYRLHKNWNNRCGKHAWKKLFSIVIFVLPWCLNTMVQCIVA